MHAWIQTHGFEVLFIAGLFSLIMSSAPEPPKGWGFWKLWAFGAAKAAGANAGKYAHNDAQASQFTQTQVVTGDKVVTNTQATSIPVTEESATPQTPKA